VEQFGVAIGASDASEIWKRITEIYGVSLADVRCGRFVDIFAAITLRKSVN
jgi:hypothetical protein